MTKLKIGLGVAVVALVAVGAVGMQRGWFSEPAKAAAGPGAFAMPVPVTKIAKKTIPIYLDYAARTEAIQNIALQSKIAGYVLKQHVADGADVKEGDLLYTIDPRDYQAALDSVKATLAQSTAGLDYAKGNVERGTSLASSGYLDKNTFEQRTSNLKQSEAGIAIAQAAVRSAEINLSYTEIRAPFTGRLGRNQASVGTLITAGSATLNTLVQLDPVYVTFNPSETDLAAIGQARAKGKVNAEVFLPGDDKPRYKGEVTFVDNTVDRSTGTIVARATIANTDRTLLPGQYVRIRLAIAEKTDALLVPQVALGSSQLGKYVYVVGKDDKAEMRLVTLGPTDGSLVAIEKGVAEGDSIISGNLQKIGPGSPVKPLPPQ